MIEPFSVYKCCNCDYIYEGITGPVPDCVNCGDLYFKKQKERIKELKIDTSGETLQRE